MGVQRNSAITLTICCALLLLACQQIPAQGLLTNPGFPSGTVPQHAAAGPWTQVLGGWTYSCPGAEDMIVYNENCGYYGDAQYHPSGAIDAVRTRKVSNTGNPGDAYIYQDVAGSPNTDYAASVWARARGNFGTYGGDIAELTVEEYDSGNNLITSYTDSINAANTDYEQLSVSFKTGGSTAKLRFQLHTRVTGYYGEGDVTWDDCAFYPVVAPAMVTGVVLCDGLPVAGATVTCEGQTTTTDSKGVYTIDGITVTGSASTVSAAKLGYRSASATAVLVSGTNTVNVRIDKMPFLNYLVNGGFAAGTIPQNDSSGPWSEVKGGWTYSKPGTEAMVIYNESAPYYAGTQAYHPAGAVDAVRTRKVGNTGNPGDVYIYQDVAAVAGAQYEAYAWARARGAFGTYEGDIAEMTIEEYDSGDSLVASVADSISVANTDHEMLSASFVTTPTTTRIRFTVHTRLTCAYWDGDVTWDDCGLYSPSVPQASVTGTVSSRGSAIEGATVTCQGASTTTNAEGVYTLTDIMIPDGAAQVQASKAGYMTGTASVTLVSGTNTVNIEIFEKPSGNMLVNGDFADGVANLIMMGYGYVEEIAGWTYSFPSDVASAIPVSKGPGHAMVYHPSGAADAVLLCRAYETDYPGVAEVYQFVDVSPNTQYSGYLWMYGKDNMGYGFGRNPDDKVEFLIEEYDALDNLLASHLEIHTTPMFVDAHIPMGASFTTTSDTTKIRFLVRATIQCSTGDGYVNLDDCYFGQGASYVGTVTGTVSCEGSPVADVEVNLLGKTTTTDASGKYTIANLATDGLTYTATAARGGYYPAARLVKLTGGVNVVDFSLSAAGSNNLLRNGGFEAGAPLLNPFSNTDPETTYKDWTFRALGEPMIVAYESLGVYGSNDFYPEGALDALRNRKVANTGTPGQVIAYQDVDVLPNTDLTASVLVRARGAFGSSPGDSAALEVVEYSSGGSELKMNSIAVTKANTAYESLVMSFRTTSNTAKVRFTLHTTITCSYAQGDVTYEDCALVVGLPATIAGTVTNTGGGLAGATITFEELWSADIDENGAYTIAGVPPISRPSTLIAKMPGHYDYAYTFSPVAGTNTVNCALTPLPAVNLLMNGGFERGVPDIGYQGFGYSRTFSGWNYLIPGETMQVAQESRKYHPDDPWLGWSAVRLGKQAFTGNSGEVLMSQDVSALPSSPYRATAYTLTRNGRGLGFGSDTRDKVRIVVEEYDQSGALQAVNTSPAVVKSTRRNYLPVETSFTTTASTAMLRFRIESAMSNAIASGDVSIDDCILAGPPVPLSALKNLADGAKVSSSGEVVSAVYDGYFYIEAADRSNGIRVIGGNVEPGDVVNVSGTIATVDGERTIISDFVGKIGAGVQPEPLGLNNRATSIGSGLSAVGLYVSVWGRVSSTGSETFTVSDGGADELKVYGSAVQGDYVIVTGALGSETSGDSTVPVLRAVSVTVAPE